MGALKNYLPSPKGADTRHRFSKKGLNYSNFWVSSLTSSSSQHYITFVYPWCGHGQPTPRLLIVAFGYCPIVLLRQLLFVSASNMSSVSSSSKDERRSVVTKDIIRGEQLTDWSLASKLSDMEPFLSRPVVERLKRSLPSSPIINVDEINEIKQPPSIKIATLRDYQLRGVITTASSTLTKRFFMKKKHFR